MRLKKISKSCRVKYFYASLLMGRGTENQFMARDFKDYQERGFSSR
jgi:hypothetical protein